MEEFDRKKFPPPDDTPMLPWYQGAYDHGFIALHPFYTVEGLDPRAYAYESVILEASDRPPETDFLEWMDERTASKNAEKAIPDHSFFDIVKQSGRCVGWQDICLDTGLHDHRQLDRALRTRILGLKRELEDRDAAALITEYCERNKVFFPSEGYLQPTMEGRLASLFHQAGFEEIIAGDEHSWDDRIVAVESLLEPQAWDTRTDLPEYGVKRLIAPDQSILVWVHWDSFYTAIFGTNERIASLNLGGTFEGFWCSDQSTTIWLLEETIPLAT